MELVGVRLTPQAAQMAAGKRENAAVIHSICDTDKPTSKMIPVAPAAMALASGNDPLK